MNTLRIVALACVLLTGCGAASTETPTTVSTVVQQQLENDATLIAAGQQIQIIVDDIELKVKRPDNWEFYSTDYGVVLTEHIASIATEGVLGGILSYIWIPPLDDFNLPASTNANTALLILNEIVENPDYVGSATISQPQPFIWDGLDAAYYLLDNGDGNLSIVIGITVPQTTRLVTCSVGAPAAQAGRIRDMQPLLLDGLTINDITLHGDSLEILPESLEFPNHEIGAEDSAPP